MKYATYEQGGLMRCCAESLPTDEEGNVLEGKIGEHIPCKYCKESNSGVYFNGKTWIAAWRNDAT